MTEQTLTGRVAIVTGGAVGIGRAIARDLAAAGADVGVLYRAHPPDDVEAEIRAAGRRTAAAHADVTDPAAVEAAIGRLAEALGGGVDIVVANAGGMVARVAVAEMSDEHWHEVLNLNLSSAFYCVRSSLRRLRDGGRVILVSSQASRDGGGAGAAAYAAAKAGLNGFARALAKELAPRGITVNAVTPGLILDTPFHPAFTPPEAQAAAIARTPLARAGLPGDVSGAVVFLASERSSFVTGTVIDVNGGLWIG